MAWYSVNSGSRTHPVGTKQANWWGLYDMHGNVWEWVADWLGAYPSGAVADPLGPSSGVDRVFRGGSWVSAAGGCRSADRTGGVPGGRNGNLGFRVLRGQSQ
ncbi:MAG: formylglycine-generating enzyme family protein [Deltaproteobacteria bacterium]|nr:formylglycine-generating enzyme family protein [Deltaproteobacteria bacterium]